MNNKALLSSMKIICASAVLIMILACILGGGNGTTAFTPPPFDENALQGIPIVPVELGYSEIDAKVYKVCMCGNLPLSNGKVDVYLTNPNVNNVWIKLRIIDDAGNVLGESGLLYPGEYVKSIDVPSAHSGMSVSLKVMAYEPDSYYSAGSVIINTKIK